MRINMQGMSLKLNKENIVIGIININLFEIKEIKPGKCYSAL